MSYLCTSFLSHLEWFLFYLGAKRTQPVQDHVCVHMQFDYSGNSSLLFLMNTWKHMGVHISSMSRTRQFIFLLVQYNYILRHAYSFSQEDDINKLIRSTTYNYTHTKKKQNKEKNGRIKERQGKRPIKNSKVLYKKLKVALLKYAIFQLNSSKTLLHLIA